MALAYLVVSHIEQVLSLLDLFCHVVVSHRLGLARFLVNEALIPVFVRK